MSKENRLAAKKRTQQAKMKRIRNRIIKIALIVLLVAFVALCVVRAVLKNVEKKANYDRYLAADGTLDGKSALKYAKVCDYKNITLERKDLLPTESELAKAVDNVVNSKKETIDKAGTELTATSQVYLSYKVTIDGEEKSDLEAKEKSYTLGSKSLSEDFDKAIAAKKVGDSFSIEIKYAADFSNTTYAGKTVKFDGKVDKVVVVPELTDKFVADKCTDTMEGSEYPLTVDGLKDFCANQIYEDNLNAAIADYIVDNTTVNSYPYFFTKNVYYLSDKNYKYYVDYYNQMFGGQMYSNPVDLLGLDSQSAYKKRLKEESRETVKSVLAYQAVYEDAGVAAVTEEEIIAYVKDKMELEYGEAKDTYGANYLAQLTLQNKTFNYVKELVTVTGDTSVMTVPDPAPEATEAPSTEAK